MNMAFRRPKLNTSFGTLEKIDREVTIDDTPWAKPPLVAICALFTCRILEPTVCL